MRTIILIIAGAVFGGLESPFFAIIGAILGALIARSTSSPALPDHRSYGHSSPPVHLLDPLHSHRFSADDDWQVISSNDHSDAPLQIDHDVHSPFSDDSDLLADSFAFSDHLDHSVSPINPATGLPMMGDMEAGFDVGGNLYGTGTDDAFNSSSFDDDPIR